MALPTIGAQVVILPVEGDAESCVVLGLTFNDVDTPPAGYPPDEFWLVHKSGSAIQLQASGNVNIVAASSVTVTAPGGVVVTGNLTVTGNISAGNGATGTFSTPMGNTVTVKDGITENIT